MGKQSLDRKKKDKKKKKNSNKNDDDKKKKKDKMKKKGSKVSQSPQNLKQSPPQLSSPRKKMDEKEGAEDLEKPPIEYGSDQSGNRKKLSDKEPKLKKKSSKIEPPKEVPDEKEGDDQMKKGPTSNMKKVSSGNIKKRSARLDVQKGSSSEEKELVKVKKVPSSNIKKIPSTTVKKRSSRIEIPKDLSDEKQLNDEEKVKRALTSNMRKISPANTKKRSSRLDIPKDLSDENLNGDDMNGKKVSTSNMKKLSPANPKKRSSRHELPKDLSDDDYFGEVKNVPSSANKKVSSGRMEVKKTPSKSAFGQIPKKISKTGLSPESTGNSDQHEVRMTPSAVRRDLYNVMDEADGISEVKRLDYDPQQSLQKTQSDIGPPKSVSGSNPLQPIRSQLQMPNTLGIAKNSPGGITVHPLSLVRIDGDLIGRTGMYIERSGMSAAKKRAFDWLGLNRHQYQQKAGETVKNLEIALSDVGISKELFNQTLPILLADRQITQTEMDSVKQKLSNEYRGDFLTLSSAAWLLKENCRTYRRLEDEE